MTNVAITGVTEVCRVEMDRAVNSNSVGIQ